jgi:hypothetical protein
MNSIKYLAPVSFAAILLVAVSVAAASDLSANPSNAAQDDQSRNLQSPPLTGKSLSDLLERARLHPKPPEVMGRASPEALRALSNKAAVTPQQNFFPPNSLQGPNASDLTNKDAQTGQASKKLAPPAQ